MIFSEPPRVAVLNVTRCVGEGGRGGGERTNNATKAGCQVIVTEAC